MVSERSESGTAGDAGPRGYQRVESSIVVDAPVETVWAVVADPDTFPEAIEWVAEVTRDGEGPLEAGGVYVERAKPGIRWGTYRWEVTEYEPPRRAVHVHESGEIEAHLAIDLEPLDDDRTRYSQTMDFRALPAFRPLGYVLERTAMKWQMQRDFDRSILPSFKALAERRAAED